MILEDRTINSANTNTIAAIDLGSNSFHMVVAKEKNGQLVIIDRIREMVRLAEGLDEDGNLDPVVEERALDCLGRLGQRIRSLEVENVSAVGTNTLRRASHADDFIFQAEQALGFPIEIISGIEEARLIYQGVAHTLEQDQKSRLLVDIGGGSTELIIGESFLPKLMNSLEMGCVVMTKKFFADGKIRTKRIQQARVYTLQRLKAVRHAYLGMGWQTVMGSSGSIKSIESVIHEMKLDPTEGIGREALDRLLVLCSDYKKISKLDLPGLSDRRRDVFMGGLIVLHGVFEALGIERMQVSQGALREGLLYDMLGRRHNKDIRNQSINSLANRFHVNQQHAQRIEQTAFDFLQQLKAPWFRDWQHASNLLRWACESHEIGRDISHSGFQRHSAYILENADLAGFSRHEQRRLATIVNAHRGKLNADMFREPHPALRDLMVHLSVVLRLAVIFHRSRVETTLPAIGLTLEGAALSLSIPDQWLNEHPLTINDLEQEANYLRSIGLSLSIDHRI